MRKRRSVGVFELGFVLCCSLWVGCGDLTSAIGDQGRLEFTLATDYVIDGKLGDVPLVAGHEQRLSIDLTDEGEDDIEEPDEITYRAVPPEGVSIDAVGGSGSIPPDIDILVTKPGTYELRAIYKGRVVDSLSLPFEAPSALELDVKVRAPWAEKFSETSGSATTVLEGAHAVFLPIPLDADGERLAGRIVTETSADPAELVVSGVDVNGVYEQRVWTGRGKIELYFIDPGTVTVTVKDAVSGASGQHTFTVENVGG
jgi:hypothetical protein